MKKYREDDCLTSTIKTLMHAVHAVVQNSMNSLPIKRPRLWWHFPNSREIILPVYENGLLSLSIKKSKRRYIFKSPDVKYTSNEYSMIKFDWPL